MFGSFEKSQYWKINCILIGCIVSIFIYAAIFPPEGKYPIASNQKLFNNKATVSSGLSRGFSSIVRLRFHDATLYNPFSLRIFCFFLIELLLKVLLILMLQNHLFTIQQLVVFDSVSSALLFLILFWPFLIDLFIK
jgi:hypothetical protein